MPGQTPAVDCEEIACFGRRSRDCRQWLSLKFKLSHYHTTQDLLPVSNSASSVKVPRSAGVHHPQIGVRCFYHVKGHPKVAVLSPTVAPTVLQERQLFRKIVAQADYLVAASWLFARFRRRHNASVRHLLRHERLIDRESDQNRPRGWISQATEKVRQSSYSVVRASFVLERVLCLFRRRGGELARDVGIERRFAATSRRQHLTAGARHRALVSREGTIGNQFLDIQALRAQDRRGVLILPRNPLARGREGMSGATAFLALILDRAAPLPQIHMLQDRPRRPRSPVHPVPHIVNVAECAKFLIQHWSRPKVTNRTSFECRWSSSFGVIASTAALPVGVTRMLL